MIDFLSAHNFLSPSINLLGIKTLSTSAYSPSGNGDVECVSHTVAQMLAVVCNEQHDDSGTYLPHAEFGYKNSVSAPNEVHARRFSRLTLTIVDRSYSGAHESLARNQLAYQDLARNCRQLTFEFAWEDHSLTVTRIQGRNSSTSNGLRRRPKYRAGIWIWVYIAASTFRQCLLRCTDIDVLTERPHFTGKHPFEFPLSVHPLRPIPPTVII